MRSRSASAARGEARGRAASCRGCKLVDQDYLLYDALAGVGDKPALVPRASWPTWYVADGTGTLFARTRWDERAVWFVAECQRAASTSITAIPTPATSCCRAARTT